MIEDSERDLTLDDDIWKDSFDRLLNKRSLLRELNVLKPNVRISFNNDSSVEASKIGVSNHLDKEQNGSVDNENKGTSGFISTPILRKKIKGPFDCPLSPISSWKLTHLISRNEWQSYLTEKSIQSMKGSLLSPRMISASTIRPFQINKPENVANLLNPTDEDRLGPVPTKSGIIVQTKIYEIENNNAVLPPGKWRKSLIVWKRLNHVKIEAPEQYSSSVNLTSKRSRRTNVHRKSQDSRDKLLKICKQKSPLLFSSIYSDDALRKCRKIGEGTYGEVFMNSNDDEDIVLKIIPIEGKVNINGEPQKSFDQVLPEILITKYLSELRTGSKFCSSGFVYLKNVRLIKGRYPDHLIDLWNLYDKNYGSENDHPDIFNEDQLFVSLEIAYGGKDLDGSALLNSEQAYSVFTQITICLAVAEKCMQFEHRDLHCGNILIQTTKDKSLEYIINNNKIKIPTYGIKVTIIDYTLSRMTLASTCYYNDLTADNDLFCAEGDYQYEIYRMMKQQLGNNWKRYDPKTNVMWLHYLLTKLLTDVKYKNCKSKKHLYNIDKLNTIRDTILENNSAFECFNKIYQI